MGISAAGLKEIRKIRFAAFLLLSAVLISPSLAENIVSRPAGVVQIRLKGQALVSMNFEAFDPSINAVLEGQLTGTTNEAAPFRVLKWDPSLSQYLEASRGEDGKWYADLDKGVPSEMTFWPGDAFWIQSRSVGSFGQDTNQTVFLAGEVVLEATNTIRLVPSLQGIGYPFSTIIRFDETKLWELWKEEQKKQDEGLKDEIIDPSTNASLEEMKLGKGYWYNRKSQESLVWAEVRPYADIFPDNGEPPLITGISIVGKGEGIKLSIQCGGVVGERLDIFYQDITESNRFDTINGWHIAETDIPVQRILRINGMKSIEWTDSGGAGRSPVSEVFARYYLVGRSDIDSDGDGVSDAREIFVYHTDARISIGSSVSGTATLLTTFAEAQGTNPVSPGIVITNSPPAPEPEPDWVIGKIIYVDKKLGADTYTGRAPIVVGADGPKKTIKAGLAAAGSGDTLIINEGHYGEDLNISGRNISVRIQGHVDLSGRCHQQTEQPEPSPPPGHTNINVGAASAPR